MSKRVSCTYCSHVDFINDKVGDGWVFLGYDDEAELWCCPNCADIPSDDLPFGGWAPNDADLLLFEPSNKACSGLPDSSPLEHDPDDILCTCPECYRKLGSR